MLPPLPVFRSTFSGAADERQRQRDVSHKREACAPMDGTFTTIELKINFLRPVWEARLRTEARVDRAEARVDRAGKVVGLVECDILDEQERLVAPASSTCMTLRGHLAEGRELPTE
jgi:acyl-coenzyme A thioesterase PaaI-like protein